MRKMIVSFVVLSIAATAVAADSLSLSQEARDRQTYVADHTRSRFMPDVVTTKKGDYWFVIPAAGSLAGAFGTNFKSDVMISNNRNVSQRVAIKFFPLGQDGSLAPTTTVTVPASGMLFLPDIVGRTIGKSGIGTLDLRARTSTDDLDTSANLDATSRIWTPQANAANTVFAGGTTSQSFPALPIGNLDGPTSATIIGLQQDGTFRSNVGIFNHDLFSQRTFNVQLRGSGGNTSFSITVPAWSMNQVSVPAGNWGNFMLTITPESAFNEWWSAYASSSDNITGDGWVSIGSQNNQ